MNEKQKAASIAKYKTNPEKQKAASIAKYKINPEKQKAQLLWPGIKSTLRSRSQLM